jgi:hypothetical protein
MFPDNNRKEIEGPDGNRKIRDKGMTGDLRMAD